MEPNSFKKILIISYSPLHRDPRILRQVQALKNEYNISTIGDTPIVDSNIHHYNNSPNTILYHKKINVKLHKLFYLLKHIYKYYPTFIELKLNFEFIFTQNIKCPNIIIANDWDGLYLASGLKNKYKWNSKIYFDAHEYAPKQFEEKIKWRIFMKPLIIKSLQDCKKDISIMSTVCDGIAKNYEKFFNFPSGSIRIITNTSEYKANLLPNKIINNKIKLIHHGAAQKERNLELMINMMKYLNSEKYELTFMLIPSQLKYYNHLMKLSKKYININFINPVNLNEITETINKFDIGIYILKPNNYNEKYALPNKFFEFLQARLAIAIGPSIEMVKIINQYNLGIYSKKFTSKSLANSINNLTFERIMEYKSNANTFAQELSSTVNINKIKNIIDELLKAG